MHCGRWGSLLHSDCPLCRPRHLPPARGPRWKGEVTERYRCALVGILVPEAEPFSQLPSSVRDAVLPSVGWQLAALSSVLTSARRCCCHGPLHQASCYLQAMSLLLHLASLFLLISHALLHLTGENKNKNLTHTYTKPGLLQTPLSNEDFFFFCLALGKPKSNNMPGITLRSWCFLHAE